MPTACRGPVGCARERPHSRSAALDAALAAGLTAAISRSRFPLLAATPHAVLLVRSAGHWGRRAPEVAAGELLADLTGLAALLAGSIRHRSLLL